MTLSLAPPAEATQWFDALIAEVNHKPVLVSDVSAYEVLFHSGTRIEALPVSARHDAVSRYIEHRLLLAEANRFGITEPSREAVENTAADLIQPLGERPWWISRQALHQRVREKLWVEGFINARIHAFIMIRESQVDQAVADDTGPNPGESGGKVRARVRTELEKTATQKQLRDYLDRLLSRAKIKRYLLPSLDF